MTVCKTYIVSVDFNFEGQKNKYLEEIKALGARQGYPVGSDPHKTYDFLVSFKGVEVGDLLVVQCATGLQVVKAVAVSHPEEIPAHATARVIAKLDTEGIERHIDMAKHHEVLSIDIADRVREATEAKRLKKLAKQDKELAKMVNARNLLEGKGYVEFKIHNVREREGE